LEYEYWCQQTVLMSCFEILLVLECCWAGV